MGLYLEHYGTPRHSGRYPWGSGEDPYQSLSGSGGMDFLGQVKAYQKTGMSEKQIADLMGISTSELRNRKSNATNELRAAQMSEALRLKDKGMSNVAIGERLGVGESTVRNLLKYSVQRRENVAAKTADILKDAVKEKGFIDVGAGTNLFLNVSDTKFKALKMKAMKLCIFKLISWELVIKLH